TTSGSLQASRMNHDELAALGTEDVEIGAHCEQHVDMRSLTTEQCRHELEASRRVLQEISGQAINGFAYPGGRQNVEVRKQVARAGFTYAAGTFRGLNRAPFDAYNLYRLGAPDAGVSDYKRCLANAAGPAPQQMGLESVQWP
ncbi:MAG: polysaccharide deacetylase family protein, partial [Proteobacteria bacterium]|nr:polysaccharide deacetylase family protein [Pseudomonadota bacterium]